MDRKSQVCAILKLRCWRIYFQVLEVLFLASVSQAFLPPKKACGIHKFQHFWVRQQYPGVFLTLAGSHPTRGIATATFCPFATGGRHPRVHVPAFPVSYLPGVTVSLKAGLYTYKTLASDAQQPPLVPRCGFQRRLKRRRSSGSAALCLITQEWTRRKSLPTTRHVGRDFRRSPRRSASTVLREP